MSLGTLRFVLALFVALSHLWQHMPHGYAAYAVWGFFVLSGYLMTRILREKYGFTATGLRDFAINRFLRIYPAYWLASLLGIAVVFLTRAYDVDVAKLNPEFGLPRDAWGWLFPVTLLPIFDRQQMPIAVANALGIEVGFYLLMPLMAYRRWIAWGFLAFGVGLLFYYGLAGASFGVRYATFWPCALAFSLGALAAHYAVALRRIGDWRAPAFAWFINSLVWFRVGSWPWTYGLYIASALSAWLVISLADRKQSNWDKWLGDLSYPLYLLHTTAGGLFLIVFGYERTLLFCVVSIVAALVLSQLFVSYIDRPLQSIRRIPRAPPPVR